MAAGLGFKDFTTGEVLTAADVDGYLMQGVWVFDSAAARDAAVTSPQEGNFAYLKDTNVTTYYTGSAWANLDTTGMTNPMTTTGDVIYSSSGSTPARLGIGTAGQVLTVNSGATAPEWAAPASGWSPNLTLLSTTSASGGSTTINVSSYDYYVIRCSGLSSTNASAWLNFRINGSSTAGNYIAQQQYKGKGNTQTTPAYTDTGFRQLDGNTSFIELARTGTNAAKTVNALITIIGGKTTGAKSIQWTTSPDYDQAEGAGSEGSTGNGIFSNSAAITSFTFLFSTGDFDAGDIYVYGG